MLLARPAQRSVNTITLVGLWVFGLLGAVLALIGTLFQILGVTPQGNSPLILRWLLFGSLGLGAWSCLMIWGYWGRHVFILYLGIGLAALIGVAGVGAGLILKGPLALALASGGVLAAIALILTHVAALPEFRGERRRQSFEVSATSGKGLYQAGREWHAAGLHFLAAQCWARAIGKEPGNAAYMHTLALVLARLGHRERALGQLERALGIDPKNSEIRRSYEMILQASDSRQATRADPI
jgi:tetratricopeptide (TPR) repeat protein